MRTNPEPPPYKTRKGRPKGTPNKATVNAREAIGAFVEGNVGRLNDLLATIEKEEGALATWNCILGLIDFHVPRLARQEIKGDHQFTLVVNTGVNAPVALPVKEALPVIEGEPIDPE